MTVGWFTFKSSCCGARDRPATLSKALPALSPAIAVPVCCRKAPLRAGKHLAVPVALGFLSFPTCAGPQAARGLQLPCPERLQAVGAMGLASSPTLDVVLSPIPPGTGAGMGPQGSSVRSAGCGLQQHFLLPDPTALLPALSSCCSSFC